MEQLVYFENLNNKTIQNDCKIPDHFSIKFVYIENNNICYIKSIMGLFKLKEFILKSNQKIHISKKQIFKDLSTRKHKEGLYNLVLFVNGKEYFKSDFKIKNSY